MEQLALMIKRGASIDEVDLVHKFTPLHCAAHSGSLEVKSYNHRIIEWPGLKRTIMIIQFQPPCYVQGHQSPDQAAQSHIQPGLECLQGWGIHNLLGQPVPVCHYPLCEKLPPNI